MFTDTYIKDLLIFEPSIFTDHRGDFFESYNKKLFANAGITCDFVQDNQIASTYGVLRGLHFQTGKHAQAKLVRVLHGAVLDVAVDIRKNSLTFGKYFSIELSSNNNKQLFIPRGFAHGFVVLSDTAIFSYKCDNYYYKNAESGIYFQDPNLAIDWILPANDLIINQRDMQLQRLENFYQVL